MSRKLYVLTFIAFATAFLPVIVHFGLAVYVVPSAWLVASFGASVFRGVFVRSFWVLGYLAIYLLMFYAAARATFWMATRPASKTGRWTIQLVVLLALFSCSFLRVLTYSSIRGGGGTYTFWGAVSRQLDRHDAR